MSRPALLHNMSAPPQTVIQHRAPSPSGFPMVFGLRCGFGNCSSPVILARLDGRPWRHGTEQAEAELRRRLDEHAARLAFPPAVLVAPMAEAMDCADDLLTICTVLAKSSDRVYLRDKEPNLARIEPGHNIVLYLPGETEEKA